MPPVVATALLAVFLLALPGTSAGEDRDRPADITELSLEELLGITTTVATIRPVTTRETPGIVSLVTAEEIRASGARDLMDVLMLVPGIQFATDVQSVIGIGVRGLWGHEGKVLLLIDGIEMNEGLFATLQFGNHYPVENIAQVEVIRGPGSVLYGGSAELAVINVVTRSGAEVAGFRADGVYSLLLDDGFESRGYGRRTVSLAHGRRFDDLDLDYSVFLKLGQGRRHYADYVDVYGDSYSMAQASDAGPLHLNAAVGFRGLDLRLIVDRYTGNQRDGFDEAFPWPIQNNFNTYAARLSYGIELADGLTLTPRVGYRFQEPWQARDDGAFDLGWYYDKVTHNATADLVLDWAITDWIGLVAGVAYTWDRAAVRGTAEQREQATLFEGTETSLDFHGGAVFAEGRFDTFLGSFVAGARYEHHQEYGGAFVPRGAYTKLLGDLHFKLLASQAFRAPSVENYSLATQLEPDPVKLTPEKTTIFEGEVGYLFARRLLVTVNAFYLLVQDPFIYFWDEASQQEGYRNVSDTSAFGGEAEARLRYGWGFVTLGYSFARPIESNAFYTVPGRDDTILGFATHKATLAASFRLGDHLRLGPSAVLLSERWAATGVDADEELVYEALPAVVLANLAVSWEDFLTRGLTLGGGLYNIFDARFSFPQPYDSWHAPLPALGRELLVRLSYDLPF
jgi:outer membrane cobalamin receptor